MNLYAMVIASYTYIGSVDFYEVQPLLTAQQRLYNKSFQPHNHVYMFTVIGFMLTGITVGYLFRNYCLFAKDRKDHFDYYFSSVVPAWNLSRFK